MRFRPLAIALFLAATPTVAAAHYKAEPVVQPAETKIALRDVLWTCGGAGCTGGKSNSRPAIVCAVLAREVGALKSFSANGEPLTPKQLQECNARAG